MGKVLVPQSLRRAWQSPKAVMRTLPPAGVCYPSGAVHISDKAFRHHLGDTQVPYACVVVQVPRSACSAASYTLGGSLWWLKYWVPATHVGDQQELLTMVLHGPASAAVDI